MNKIAVIGAILAVIIGIIIVSAAFSMDSTEDSDSALEEAQLGESIPVEESEVEETVEESEVEETVEESEVEETVEESEVEETGKDLSVEFTESVGLKTP